MTLLSVNINKIATLRNSRGKNKPDLLYWAKEILSYGAHGITVHPRPDARHVRHSDVYDLKKEISAELNVEGYPDPHFLALICAVRPAQCTLVPDSPEALTSNAGWNIKENYDFLKKIKQDLPVETRISLFIDPNYFTEQDRDLLLTLGVDRIELYTEAYADAYGTTQEAEVLNVYRKLALELTHLGIGINAGHDLNLMNLKTFLTDIPDVLEVSIGHALICDALSFGMKETIERYLAII